MPQSQTNIQQAYDLASEAYAREFIDELNNKPVDVQLLQQFADKIGTGRRVLDLGCGPGHTTAHLNSLGLKPVGIDLSPAMIAKASELFPGSQFEVGSFFNLQHDDSSVAGILAFYCIVHLQPEQLVVAFAEMFRVLSPGGIIRLSFHVGEETIFANSFLDTDATLEFRFFPTVSVQTALITAGFSDLEIHERPPYDSEHPSTRCYVLGRKSIHST